MNLTWDGEPPPPLPVLRMADHLRGLVRLAGFLAGTLALMPVFLALRVTGGSRDRWAAMLWSRMCLACLGLRVERRGTPLVKGLLAVNHVSWADPLAVGAAARAFFVAKREVRSWPGIGLLCRLGRVEFVDRRVSAARQQAACIAGRLKRGHLLCIFPEGTTSDGLRVLRFRSTLFAATLAEGHSGQVQPVCILYRPDPGSALPDSYYGWWGEMEFADNLWEMLCRSRRGRVQVVFLSPLTASAFPDRKVLAAACQASVLDCMQRARCSQAELQE